MPLSEHEQRVLEQIERALYAEDPKFAAAVRGIDPKTRQRRRLVRAGIGVVVGLALLPVGIAIDPATDSAWTNGAAARSPKPKAPGGTSRSSLAE